VTRGAAAGWLPHLQGTANADAWEALLAPFDELAAPTISLHLAVLVEPYLGFILDGRKTIESRFSVRPSPPYGRVEDGDIVLLKESGGPVVGAFTASAAWHYRLDPASWTELRRDFTDALCAQDGFWEARAAAEYATLIGISQAQRLPPVTIPKRDRRGWVVLADRNESDRLL
jgi:hypothetical protein